jgi:hypothetical protein
MVGSCAELVADALAMIAVCPWGCAPLVRGKTAKTTARTTARRILVLMGIWYDYNNRLSILKGTI